MALPVVIAGLFVALVAVSVVRAHRQGAQLPPLPGDVSATTSATAPTAAPAHAYAHAQHAQVTDAPSAPACTPVDTATQQVVCGQDGSAVCGTYQTPAPLFGTLTGWRCSIEVGSGRNLSRA